MRLLICYILSIFLLISCKHSAPTNITANNNRGKAESISAIPLEYYSIQSSKSITRGELSAIIAIELNVAKTDMNSVPYLASDIREHWAKRYIEYVMINKIIEPYPDGMFKPSEIITRGFLALTIEKILLAKKSQLVSQYVDKRPQISAFSDISTTSYLYPAVALVTENNIMTSKTTYTGHLIFALDDPVEGMEAIEAMRKVKKMIGSR